MTRLALLALVTAVTSGVPALAADPPKPVVNSVGMAMVPIPAGSFTMGTAGAPPTNRLEWMARDENLSERISYAREQGFEAIAEEALLIADTPVFGQKQVMTDQGTATTVEDMLGHRKLQIETRLKLLAKWNPKKYGDKVQVGGDAENPLKVQTDLTIFDTVLKGIEQSRRG